MLGLVWLVVDDNELAIGGAGGIPPILDVLKYSDNIPLLAQAARAIRNLSVCK